MLFIITINYFFRDQTLKNLDEVNRRLGFREEKRGHIFDTIEVDTIMQLQAINEVSLRIVSTSFTKKFDY